MTPPTPFTLFSLFLLLAFRVSVSKAAAGFSRLVHSLSLFFCLTLWVLPKNWFLCFSFSFWGEVGVNKDNIICEMNTLRSSCRTYPQHTTLFSSCCCCGLFSGSTCPWHLDSVFKKQLFLSFEIESVSVIMNLYSLSSVTAALLSAHLFWLELNSGGCSD